MKTMKAVYTLVAVLAIVAIAPIAYAQVPPGVIPGCFPGNIYSTASGQSCAGSLTDNGCIVNGNVFSTVTGARCPISISNPVPTPSFPNTGNSPVASTTALALVALGVVGATVLVVNKKFSTAK